MQLCLLPNRLQRWRLKERDQELRSWTTMANKFITDNVHLMPMKEKKIKDTTQRDRERLEALEKQLVAGLKSAKRKLSMDEVREKGLISVLRERQRKLSH